MGNLPTNDSDQSDESTLIMTTRGLESPARVRVRDLCSAYIERTYPVYMQLNILRSGTKDEKAKMDAFIDACRAWSNDTNPDPVNLQKIISGAA